MQIFRVSDYEAYKNRISPRHDGTCQWLLKNPDFKSWLTSTHACPLLVTADPGCGRSVLTRHIVGHELPESVTICYFFFNDQSQNRANQALCALLHQLLSQRPILIKHAMDKFASDGEKLPDMTSSLWVILGNAIRDKEADDVIFVVDALDECSHSDLPDFMRNIRNLFNDDHEKPSFKFFPTGRPYEWVTLQFRDLTQDFPTIRIPGEDEEHTGLISQDIDAVIKSRVNSLANKLGLKEELKDHLNKRLCEIKHRTYLWIHLVFWFLEEHSFHKTMKGIDAAVAKLPNRDEAYERILELSTNPEKARKAISIMLAAEVPLSLKELQIAVPTTSETLCANDLDLEDEDDFYMTLRGWCGLFVHVHHQKVYFLHQTAREFLLSAEDSEDPASESRLWLHSTTIEKAHQVLAESCYRYLNFNESVSYCLELDATLKRLLSDNVPSPAETWSLSNIAKTEHPFLRYALQHRDHHHLAAGNGGSSTVKELRRDWSRNGIDNPWRELRKSFRGLLFASWIDIEFLMEGRSVRHFS